MQMKKGSFLRRSGVSFRSAVEESQTKKSLIENTPDPSKVCEQRVAPMVGTIVVLAEHTKQKRRKRPTHAESDISKKNKMRRVLESSDEENGDDDDENKRAVKSDKHDCATGGVTAMNKASEERRDKETNEQSGAEQVGALRSVGQKNKNIGEGYASVDQKEERSGQDGLSYDPSS